MKNENRVFILIDRERVFDKIQHSFMTKIGIEKLYLNLIKISSQTHHQNHIKWRKNKSIPYKTWKKESASILTTFVQYST